MVGVVAVVGLLGLPSHALSVFLLQGPLHVGTVLFCLVAFGALRVERGGRYVVVAVAALAAGLLGDALTLGVGVLPVLVVGLAEAGRARRLAAGRWRVTAALGSVAVAVAVRAVASLLGTFAVSKTGQPATRSEVATNLGLLPRYLAALFGVRVHGFAAGGVPTGLALVHLAGIAVALGGVVAGVVALTRRRGGTPGGLDALLVVAFAADLAVFVLLTRAPLSAYARYLTGAVVFASILGARLLARASEPGARATGRSRRRWGVAHRAAAGAGIGVVAAFGAGIGVDLARPVPPRPAAELARFLAAHHLVSGIGGYWSASLVTVDSARAVRVRPVVAGPAGLLERYPHNSRRSWYAMQPFRFLVYRPTVPFGNVDEETATRTFGPPSRHYEVAGYRVLVWPQPVYVPLGPGPAGSGPDMPRSGAAG